MPKFNISIHFYFKIATSSFTNYSRVDRDEDVLYNCAVRCCSSP